MQSVPAGLAPPRTSPSGRLPVAVHTSILIALLAASSAPLDITVVFSAYGLALLIALLTTGTLSDHVGRRPVLLGTFAVQVASMALFATADGLTTLIGAHVLQGIAADPVLVFTGAALAGFGLGAVSQGALRAVVDSVPAREKGGTPASYYVLGYLAMSLPAIDAGALTAGFGLRAAALAHAGCVAVLATIAVSTLTAPRHSRRRTPSADAHSRPATSNYTSASPDTPAPEISVLATPNR
ncbi:MFS transporter [Streptomyces sp. NBC_01171]|uniref:MFS transporter n=1 Tax=Streptomyces sp. NBC_01171 TaxID=2903757 RepID=UPI0038658F3B|nr:MFS transporter [Streptomyces sp. NBC_01171]